MKGTIFTLATIFLTSVSASAYSHLLNFPRIGDKMDISVLSGKSVKTDTLSTTVDLTVSTIETNERYSVWAAAPGDTLTAMMVMAGREQKYLTAKGYNLFCRSVIRPGYVRYFKNELPYAINNHSACLFRVTSQGRADGISEYTSDGQSEYKYRGGCTIILPEADTICNVERITHSIIEKMMFGDSVVMHHCNISEWYAPGYRYPVISHQSDIMLTVDKDTIDTNSRWTYIAPATQEDVITDDPINENIRAEINALRNENAAEQPRRNHDKAETMPSNIRWNSDRTTITVSRPTITGEQYGQVILCDVQGRVFHASHFTNDSNDIQINVSSLNNGTFILYIGTDSEPITYRFII